MMPLTAVFKPMGLDLSGTVSWSLLGLRGRVGNGKATRLRTVFITPGQP